MRLGSRRAPPPINADPTVYDPGAYLNDLKAMGISSPGGDKALLGG